MLVVQAAGIALPALVAAVLFGATFQGVSTLALAVGARLRFPRSVALPTAGYSVGQILGPLVVAPLLHHGYRPALLLAALVVLGGGRGRRRAAHRLPAPHGRRRTHSSLGAARSEQGRGRSRPAPGQLTWSRS
ncbi:hypothetical protein ACFW91_25555 [Streptomyces asoensis]|uniref:hypothetical protein n=1 Tax=Streptomyces asoensis TaxID=249586 RepID=UPI0036BBD2FF